jgi:hypothetical protein
MPVIAMLKVEKLLSANMDVLVQKPPFLLIQKFKNMHTSNLWLVRDSHIPQKTLERKIWTWQGLWLK